MKNEIIKDDWVNKVQSQTKKIYSQSTQDGVIKTRMQTGNFRYKGEE